MRNLYIVSHTHWDREWYRPFQSFRLKLIHLIDNLLILLEEDPSFKFFMLDGQTIVLDDYLAMRPENESVLRKHIQKGRILIGPWHILPDMFLVGPESHIRNLLQGDRTARAFGPKMMVGYIPDPFGHPGQVPQLLRGFGIESACLWRGLSDQPAEFWWQSPDGSQVLMVNLRDGYGNGASLPADNPAAFAETLAAAADSLQAHSAVSDFLIMYGTDHMEPPVNTSSALSKANKILKDTHVIHSTLPNFVAALKADIQKNKLILPVFSGELRDCKRIHLLPGVLSSRIWIKQRNHSSETLLTRWVEPFTVFQELTTGESSTILNQKSSLLNHTWRLLMENHPHDSICGCSIDQVHEEMKVRLDQVDQIGEELTGQSLEAIAGSINTRSLLSSSTQNEDQDSAIVVFNPTSAARTDVVCATVELQGDITEFNLLDENGVSLPYQTRGLGSRDIINMTMDAKGLRSTFGSINEGRAEGMSIQDIKIRRDGTQVYIVAIMGGEGEPNLAVWNSARKQIDEFFADPSITGYHVRARSASATEVLLTASDVPGLGYRTLRVSPRQNQEKPPVRMSPLVRALIPLARLPFIQTLVTRKRYTRPPYRIENEFFVVELEKDGTLALLDKNLNRRYTGLNAFRDGGDCGDEYNYSPPATDRFTAPSVRHVTLVQGQLQQTITAELELKTSLTLAPGRKARSKEQVNLPIKTTITLTHAVPRVDITTTIDNTARDHRLRVHFPAPFAASISSQDGHFEVVERKVGLPAFDDSWIEQPRPEVPQRAFTDISDGKVGLMIANRGLPEVEVLKNAHENAEIALTLLRSIGWLSRDDFSTRKGHAGPSMETPAAQLPGQWTFEYSVIPHTGDWRSAFQQAYAFETPLRAVATGLHTGDLPTIASFVDVTPEAFVVSAVKQSEDGRGWLVRGCNFTGDVLTVALKPWRPFKKVELVNLAEQKQASLKPDQAGLVSLQVRGHEIVTVLFAT